MAMKIDELTSLLKSKKRAPSSWAPEGCFLARSDAQSPVVHVKCYNWLMPSVIYSDSNYREDSAAGLEDRESAAAAIKSFTAALSALQDSLGQQKLQTLLGAPLGQPCLLQIGDSAREPLH